MKAQHLISAVAFSLVAAAGVASAQTSQSAVTVTTNTTTTPIAGTSGAQLGSVTIQATQSGEAGNVSLASIPFNLTTGNGASVGNLSGCQLFNPAGQALNTGANASGTTAASNTFTFDTPLQISGGQSVTLNIRCNVASGTASGGTFQFSAGMPVFTPGLMINLNASPNVRPGAQDTLVALITLSAARSGSAVQIPAVPLNAAFGNGASVQDISDCRVRNLSNLAAPLNNGGNAVGIVSGSNTVPLDVPLQVGANSSVTLALTCDVATAAPVGGTVTLGVTPGSFSASVVGGATTVAATGGTGSVFGIVTFSSAATGPGPTIPGVPNTGSGSAETMLMLTLSGLVGIAGLFLARRMMVAR